MPVKWDMNLLSEWTADLTPDLGIEAKEKGPKNKNLDAMEHLRYEQYDYVMIVCRNEVDYLNLIRDLGLEGKKIHRNAYLERLRQERSGMTM